MPESQLSPEPEGFEFGELVVNENTPIEVNEVNLIKEVNKEEKVNKKDEPIPEVEIAWHMTDTDVAELQRRDPYCQRQLETLQNGRVKRAISSLWQGVCSIGMSPTMLKDLRHWYYPCHYPNWY